MARIGLLLAKTARTIRAMFSPVTQALIEGAGIKEGDTVLDVAGGVLV